MNSEVGEETSVGRDCAGSGSPEESAPQTTEWEKRKEELVGPVHRGEVG